jgi:hypothetical protein
MKNNLLNYNLNKLIGKLVVVTHWRDFQLEDATKLGILKKIENDYFYIIDDARGYKYCRVVKENTLEFIKPLI